MSSGRGASLEDGEALWRFGSGRGGVTVGFQRGADLAGDNGGRRRVWAIPVEKRLRSLAVVSHCEMRKAVEL